MSILRRPSTINGASHPLATIPAIHANCAKITYTVWRQPPTTNGGHSMGQQQI